MVHFSHLAAERDDVSPGEDDLGGGLPVLRRLVVRPVDRLQHLLRLPVLLVYLLQQRLDLPGRKDDGLHHEKVINVLKLGKHKRASNIELLKSKIPTVSSR